MHAQPGGEAGDGAERNLEISKVAAGHQATSLTQRKLNDVEDVERVDVVGGSLMTLCEVLLSLL
jgi:hypothetical protein